MIIKDQQEDKEVVPLKAWRDAIKSVTIAFHELGSGFEPIQGLGMEMEVILNEHPITQEAFDEAIKAMKTRTIFIPELNSGVKLVRCSDNELEVTYYHDNKNNGD